MMARVGSGMPVPFALVRSTGAIMPWFGLGGKGETGGNQVSMSFGRRSVVNA